MKLSIIIPTLNEEKNIKNVIDSIPKQRLQKEGYGVDIIIADSSTDKTPEIAKKLGCTVVKAPKLGYGAAYQYAINKIKSGLIFTLDADQTYLPTEIFKFLPLTNSYDFISGNRLENYEIGAFKLINLIGNKLINLMIFVLFGIMFKDSQSGQMLFSKEAYDKLIIKETGMPFSCEIKLEAAKKLRFKEISIIYKKRLDAPKLKWYKDGKAIGIFLIKRWIKH